MFLTRQRVLFATKREWVASVVQDAIEMGCAGTRLGKPLDFLSLPLGILLFLIGGGRICVAAVITLLFLGRSGWGGSNR